MPRAVNTKISKSNFAKLAGVGRASVTLSVVRGKLTESAEGLIDTADPINAAYLAERKRKQGLARVPAKATPKAAPKASKKKLPAKKPVPPKPDPLDDDFPEIEEMTDEEINQSSDMGALTVQKIRAEIMYKREAAEAYRIKRLAILGVMVEAEQVRQLLGKFNAELRVRLLEWPRSVAPRIMAMAKSGASEQELVLLLEDNIESGFDKSKAIFSKSKIGVA